MKFFPISVCFFFFLLFFSSPVLASSLHEEAEEKTMEEDRKIVRHDVNHILQNKIVTMLHDEESAATGESIEQEYGVVA